MNQENKNLLVDRRGVIGYVIFAVAVIAGFAYADHSRSEAKRDSCISSLDNALSIRDIIDLSGGQNPNLPPERKQLVNQIYSRIEIPPRVCKGTGIDIIKYFKRDHITTTTTTTPPQQQSVGPTTSESRAPPVTIIVEYRPSISRTEGPSTASPPPTTSTTTATTAPTTTTAPSTTTTTRAIVIPLPHLTLRAERFQTADLIDFMVFGLT